MGGVLYVVSPYGRCPIMRGVPLWEVSPYGRCPLMRCPLMGCPIVGSVHLKEVSIDGQFAYKYWFNCTTWHRDSQHSVG